MKIITVLGARPQFIKAATISRAINKSNSQLTEKILHTGQHYDKNMSDVFFKEMDIPNPDFQLLVNGTGHGAMTGQMLIEIEEILKIEKPKMVLVYGDTNSTLAGALAAKKLHIPVAHVESGLRSYNMKMPEEINRILTDRISNLMFCPSTNAVKNLLEEGFENFESEIYNSGDVMYDAAKYYEKTIQKRIIKQEYVLSTIHRAENTDRIENLTSIVAALNEINKEIKVIVPLHPRTRKILEKYKLTVDFEVLEPQGYLKMINLIKYSSLVLTDSGGLQKEAFFFNKNCITMRTETEWVELVENKVNILTGSDKDKILSGYQTLIKKPFTAVTAPYGNGKAAEKIVTELEKYLN